MMPLRQEEVLPSVKGSAKLSRPPLHEMSDGAPVGPWISPERNLIIPDTSPLSTQSCSEKKSKHGEPLRTEEKIMVKAHRALHLCPAWCEPHNSPTPPNPVRQGLLASSWLPKGTQPLNDRSGFGPRHAESRATPLTSLLCCPRAQCRGSEAGGNSPQATELGQNPCSRHLWLPPRGSIPGPPAVPANSGCSAGTCCRTTRLVFQNKTEKVIPPAWVFTPAHTGGFRVWVWVHEPASHRAVSYPPCKVGFTHFIDGAQKGAVAGLRSHS